MGRYLLLLVLPVVLVTLGACGIEPPGEGRRAGSPGLVTGERDAPLRSTELGRARRAAMAFVHSYTSSIRRPGRVAVRAATPALTRELRATQARLALTVREEHLQFLALALDPRSASRVRATLTLRTVDGPPFPIVFQLDHVGGRWLVTRLPGN